MYKINLYVLELKVFVTAVYSERCFAVLFSSSQILTLAQKDMHVNRFSYVSSQFEQLLGLELPS